MVSFGQRLIASTIPYTLLYTSLYPIPWEDIISIGHPPTKYLIAALNCNEVSVFFVVHMMLSTFLFHTFLPFEMG